MVKNSYKYHSQYPYVPLAEIDTLLRPVLFTQSARRRLASSESHPGEASVGYLVIKVGKYVHDASSKHAGELRMLYTSRAWILVFARIVQPLKAPLTRRCHPRTN